MPRGFIKRLLRPVIVRIRGGPLKGAKWVAVSGSRFIRGTFEPEKTRAIQDSLGPGDVMLDVGAHVGYFTVLGSKTVGPSGKVFSFEARPDTASLLRRHIELNDCENVTLIQGAVGDAEGEARFETRTGSGTAHLSPEGDLLVPIRTIDAMVSRSELPLPDFIKIDVEGAELRVLQGGIESIRRRMPRMVVATHGEPVHSKVVALLDELGYGITEIAEPKGDLELLCEPPA